LSQIFNRPACSSLIINKLIYTIDGIAVSCILHIIVIRKSGENLPEREARLAASGNLMTAAGALSDVSADRRSQRD
jgi:hypothetical protein